MSPRFKINRNGTATLSGLPRRTLSWILDAAAVSFHERLSELRKEEDADPEDIALIEGQIKLMQLLKERECEAIAATFPPRPPLSKGERVAIVMNDRHERVLLDSLLDAIHQEHRPCETNS